MRENNMRENNCEFMISRWEDNYEWFGCDRNGSGWEDYAPQCFTECELYNEVDEDK